MSKKINKRITQKSTRKILNSTTELCDMSGSKINKANYGNGIKGDKLENSKESD